MYGWCRFVVVVVAGPPCGSHHIDSMYLLGILLIMSWSLHHQVPSLMSS